MIFTRTLRKGFDKLVPIALMHFNVTELTNEIILFINQSNSKLHKSYWIIRRGYSEKDAIDQSIKEKMQISDKFIYGGSKSIVSQNNSRGYSGYVTINGIERYCRSSGEFIMWYYLLNRYTDVRYEHKIFEVGYKPDFMIFDQGKLVAIYEIKSKGFVDIDGKYAMLESYFKNLGVAFYMILNPLEYATPEILQLLNAWKESERVIKPFRGADNPRFGMKCTPETISKIKAGQEAFRLKNPDSSKLWGEKLKLKYANDSEYHVKMCAAAKQRVENTPIARRMEIGQKAANTTKAKYFTDVNCDTCGVQYSVRNTIIDFTCRKCKKIASKKSEGTKALRTLKSILNSNIPLWKSLVGNEFEMFMLDDALFYNELFKYKQITGRLNLQFGQKSLLKAFGTFSNFANYIKTTFP